MRTGVDLQHFLDDHRLVVTAAQLLGDEDQVDEDDDGLPDPAPGEHYDADGKRVD